MRLGQGVDLGVLDVVEGLLAHQVQVAVALGHVVPLVEQEQAEVLVTALMALA